MQYLTNPNVKLIYEGEQTRELFVNYGCVPSVGDRIQIRAGIKKQINGRVWSFPNVGSEITCTLTFS